MTITSSFTGNFGNHAFIYATTRTVAEKNNYQWGFNRYPEYDYYNGIPQLEFFDINYGKEHTYKYGETPPWIEHFWQEQYKKVDYSNGDSVNFYYYQPDIFDIKDNTRLIIGCCQDARYFDKEKLKQWFVIKSKNVEIYERQLKTYDIVLDDNLCVLNVRGGEYLGIPHVLLQKKYWDDAMNIMKDKNPKMRFLCVTDDIQYGNQLFDFKIPVVHIDIGGDYYIINNAKNLIISNSSFAIFPTWLNENDPYVIAPFGWARFNVTTGYWASSEIYAFGWNFLDRDGIIYKDISYENL